MEAWQVTDIKDPGALEDSGKLKVGKEAQAAISPRKEVAAEVSAENP